MADFYAGLADTAARLLADKGQIISFSRQTGGTFDPVLGAESGASATAFTGNGAAFNYMNAEIDGTVVRRGDVRLIVESTDTVPEQGDTCTVDSAVYRVMMVEPIAPAGITVINKVQLRV